MSSTKLPSTCNFTHDNDANNIYKCIPEDADMIYPMDLGGSLSSEIFMKKIVTVSDFVIFVILKLFLQCKGLSR
jgi:hypothetical protein